MPPGRAASLFPPVLAFNLVSYLCWVAAASASLLSAWWSLALAPFASMGHFTRFRPTEYFLRRGEDEYVFR